MDTTHFAMHFAIIGGSYGFFRPAIFGTSVDQLSFYILFNAFPTLTSPMWKVTFAVVTLALGALLLCPAAAGQTTSAIEGPVIGIDLGILIEKKV